MEIKYNALLENGSVNPKILFSRKSENGYLVWTPGRVNITEYMDMLDSDQISFAIQNGIWSISERRKDQKINVKMLYYQKEMTIDFADIIAIIREAKKGFSEWKEYTWNYKHPVENKGNCFNYVLAPVLRVLFSYYDISRFYSESKKSINNSGLYGYDLTIDKGDLTIESGLSSSSCIVVLSAYHFILHNMVFANNIQDIGKLLGEAEWYTGTKGGANDHITIINGRKGKILINSFKGAKIKTAYKGIDSNYTYYIYDTPFKSRKADEMKIKFNNIMKNFVECSIICNEDENMEQKRLKPTKNTRLLGNIERANIIKTMRRLKNNNELKDIFAFYLFQSRLTELYRIAHINIEKYLYAIHHNIAGRLHNSNQYIEYLITGMKNVNGIIGAKIIGAGFGGSILIAAENNFDLKSYINSKNDQYIYNNGQIKNYCSDYKYNFQNTETNLRKIEVSEGIKIYRY